jgi:hypothetical protein
MLSILLPAKHINPPDCLSIVNLAKEYLGRLRARCLNSTFKGISKGTPFRMA